MTISFFELLPHPLRLTRRYQQQRCNLAQQFTVCNGVLYPQSNRIKRFNALHTEEAQISDASLINRFASYDEYFAIQSDEPIRRLRRIPVRQQFPTFSQSLSALQVNEDEGKPSLLLHIQLVL